MNARALLLSSALALGAIVPVGCAGRAGLPRSAPGDVVAPLRRLGAGGVPGVRTENATLAANEGALDITFGRGPGGLDLAPEALGAPRDWRGFRRLRISLENGAAPARIEVAVLAARGRLLEVRDLGARHTAVVEIDLYDLPLAAAARAPFDAHGVRVRSVGEAAGRTLRVRALALEAASSWEGSRVDAFGQRASAGWPGKVRRVEDLTAAAEEETRALRALPPPPDRNEFGGWTRGEGWQEGGFFSVEPDGGGRLWLVDPLGRPFWSLGVGRVGVGAGTRIDGREFLFEGLPERGSPPYREAFVPDGEHLALASYRWNAVRKWGSVGDWRDRTLERLERWGLNTVGAATREPDLLAQRRLPQVRSFEALSGAPVAHTPAGFPDVFDPRWSAHVEREAARHAAPEQENPWVIGYVVDDRPRWDSMALLDLPQEAPLRGRWLEFLKDRHPRLTELTAAWGRPVARWEDAQAITTATLPSGARADLAAFEALYAETYFETVARSLRQHDPNHLYLGCRFGRRPPLNAEIARAAGRHVDVLTIADDALDVERALYDRWHDLAGHKPILVGAHGVGLVGPQQIAPRGRALDERARGRHYVRFVGALARIPYVIGAHWGEYVDAPATGRGLDGGNELDGLVDVTDRPHRELVDAVREVAAAAYELHAGAR